jgi:Protein of unknown function (DUF3431)
MPRRRPLVLAAIVALLFFHLAFRDSRVEDSSGTRFFGFGKFPSPQPAGQPPAQLPQWKFGTVAPSSRIAYNRTLVIPRVRSENVSWIGEELPGLDTAIYVMDDPNAPLHPPKNKGNEAMAYLTYIIDHYEKLPDITIFMHAHRFTWHNNDILGYDAAEMVRRLSSEHVIRQGYMNLRCHWKPGCPDWLHPESHEDDIVKQEQLVMEQAWHEIFPLDPLPSVLAQPCCAQFALSRERILSVPKSRFVYYRDWLLRTPLSTYISGRIWEYIWQHVFTGKAVVCPAMHICYCDGFGLCFGGEGEFKRWFKLRYESTQLASEEEGWRAKNDKVKDAEAKGLAGELTEFDYPEVGRGDYLREKIREITDELQFMINDAAERGDDPRNRALEAGRPWKEGDGF